MSEEDCISETLSELQARHRKEMKAFEGQKRAAIKNAKSRGKKGKAALKDAEFKYDGLERDIRERHQREVEMLSGDGGEDGQDGVVGTEIAADTDAAKETVAETRPERSDRATSDEENAREEESRQEARRRAQQKKLKKKNARRQRELEREKRIEEENAQAGPSRRELEVEAMQKLYLSPRGLNVQEVEADGNCLYRAVGVQCARLGMDIVDGTKPERSYGKIRGICADVLLGSNRSEYEPFAEYDDANDYEDYVEKVRSSSTWGGQLELRALSEGLKRPIVVFSAEGPPLVMGKEFAVESDRTEDDDGDWANKSMLLLSFHRHYYALGEHYNSVVPK
ncbi:hypothetical protein THAOC_34439 [Thalassiosira oceanica]|uniref:OTU domain-containing protein n=1 Tax=Thalassiosira oceanica TaxID=159749 RepID=K0R4X5_THAOC|nr:hypothetical protein THAOC_34439 [Thalassiosira oceanica]|eukprot:EJK46879.1 hypothetical protein THAOC_34439 [Thalassiosira oceanica]